MPEISEGGECQTYFWGFVFECYHFLGLNKNLGNGEEAEDQRYKVDAGQQIIGSKGKTCQTAGRIRTYAGKEQTEHHGEPSFPKSLRPDRGSDIQPEKDQGEHFRGAEGVDGPAADCGCGNHHQDSG